MIPFEINVHVQLGVTPELRALLMSFASHTQTTRNEVSMPETTNAVKEEKELPQHTQKENTVEEVIAAKEDTEQAIKEADKVTEVEAQKEVTEIDVREAMHRTRMRIEGANYKEQPDSEGYKKWHRTLTGWFKNTATFYGAEKPSALPDSESRQSFINDCDKVEIINGELGIEPPF